MFEVIGWVIGQIAAASWPWRSTARRSERIARKYLETRKVTFPAFLSDINGALGGYLHLDDSSLRFSLSSDGKLQRTHMALGQFESYSTLVNAPDRKSDPLIPAVMRWYIVLHLTGPTVAVTVAYEPAYDDTVRRILDTLGLHGVSAE